MCTEHFVCAVLSKQIALLCISVCVKREKGRARGDRFLFFKWEIERPRGKKR